MTKEIAISYGVVQLIKARTALGKKFVDTSRAGPDGKRFVEIDDDVAEALAKVDPDPERALKLLIFGHVGWA